jgi:hypothetical protein
MKIIYRPYYAYEEVLAAFGDTSGSAGSSDTLLAEIEVISRRVTGLPGLRAPEMPEEDRQRVRQMYAFGVLPVRSPALSAAAETTDEVYAQTLRSIFNKERVWRSSNYDYRNLLSEPELKLIGQDQISRFGPLMIDYYKNSELMTEYKNVAVRNFYVFASLTLVLALAAVVLYFWPEIHFRSEIAQDLAFGVPNTWWYALGITAGVLFLIFCIYVGDQRRRRAPTGVTAKDAILLSMLGPFASDIRDYQA